jgi:hypothetical protein
MIGFRRMELENADAPASMRAALRSLLARLGRPGGADADEADASAPEAPSAETRFENKVRSVRANALAAFDSAEGSVHQAVGAALAVVEAEWRNCRKERDDFAEALKAIRLYAKDAPVRGLAARTLERRPAVAGWDAGLHIAGRDRFPFLDEFDA